MNHILSSPPAPVASSALAAHEPEQPSAKDVGEDVIHAGTAASALPKPLFAISIVQLLFLGVCQHLVGKTYLFELQGGWGVWGEGTDAELTRKYPQQTIDKGSHQ